MMSRIHSRRLLAALALLGLATLAGAGDWTGFRGPGGSAVSQEKDLPIKWSRTEGIRYKVELPGRGLSNPVIANGRVYLTAASGYRERRLHVLCFEEATGKKLWERQFTSTGNTACNPSTNMAAPTPVSDGKAVYALFATGDLAAIDAEGTLLWYRSLVGDYPNLTNQVGMATSPVLSGNVLLLALDNAGDSFAAGLDKRTGKNLWKVKRPREINWVTPLVFSSAGKPAALFVTPAGATAFEPETGKVRWRYEPRGLSSIPSPAQGEGLIFVPGGQVHALKPGDDGSTPEVVWKAGNITGGFASPVYHKGRLYGLTQVTVNCVNTSDGKEVWKQRADGPFWGSPVIAGDKLYAVNTKGRTFVVQLGEKPKLLARNDLDDTIHATPAVANGCIYLRSDKYLYCIGPKKEK
jgi:outer membrane protein assembly factor BamB